MDNEREDWSTKLRTDMVLNVGRNKHRANRQWDHHKEVCKRLGVERVLNICRELHLQLQPCASKDAFRLVVSVEEGSGLEARRVQCSRYQREDNPPSDPEQLSSRRSDASRRSLPPT